MKTHFILLELYPERIIEHTFHLLPTMTGYDMIIGTNLMSELGLKLNFQDACVEWEDASMPLRIETHLLKPHSMSKTWDRYEKAQIV